MYDLFLPLGSKWLGKFAKKNWIVVCKRFLTSEIVLTFHSKKKLFDPEHCRMCDPDLAPETFDSFRSSRNV